MSGGFKRRNYFIKKNSQGKIILSYFLFVVGGCLFFVVLLGLFSADSLTINYQDYDIQMGQTPVMLFKDAIAAHWIFLVAGGAVLVIGSMFLTHRIAGPLYRFEKVLDNMAGGRLDDIIYLRQKDEGQELAEKINTFNQLLSVKLQTINTHSRAIGQLCAQFSQLESNQATPEELSSLLQAITKNNKTIQEIGNSFTLRNE